MDACTSDHWDDLANSLPGYHCHVWLRVRAGDTEKAAVAVPFAINLVSNLIFTPIQFGMRNLPLAAADILIVWVTIIWMFVVAWKHYKWVSLAQIPYFVWVSLGTVLQLSITAMNWGRP